MDEKLKQFFKTLDRALFIDNEYKSMSGIDSPLPIGFGQTISQPTLVAEMTELLELNKDCKVLEIGTGSGYQTAFLAEFAGEVYSIELIPELSEKANKRLSDLGYLNIHYKIGDGSSGWKEYSPYDRIITTSAAGTLPTDLINQLVEGGRMIAPVGPRNCQDLLIITKDKNSEVSIKSKDKVVFVEMKGKYGWSKPET